MRSQYLMPYLLEKYSYPCFRAFNAQLEVQYAALPEVFKHIFTCDERGNIQQLRDKKEVRAALAKFFRRGGLTRRPTKRKTRTGATGPMWASAPTKRNKAFGKTGCRGPPPHGILSVNGA